MHPINQEYDPVKGSYCILRNYSRLTLQLSFKPCLSGVYIWSESLHRSPCIQVIKKLGSDKSHKCWQTVLYRAYFQFQCHFIWIIRIKFLVIKTFVHFLDQANIFLYLSFPPPPRLEPFSELCLLPSRFVYVMHINANFCADISTYQYNWESYSRQKNNSLWDWLCVGFVCARSHLFHKIYMGHQDMWVYKKKHSLYTSN